MALRKEQSVSNKFAQLIWKLTGFFLSILAVFIILFIYFIIIILDFCFNPPLVLTHVICNIGTSHLEKCINSLFV